MGCLLIFCLRLDAAPVDFKSVQATFHGGTPEALLKTIDGLEASPDGWCVAPRFELPQSAIFLTDSPIDADLLYITMFFMSGRPNASFADFSVEFTTDPNPGPEGKWENLPVLNFGASYCQLARGQGNRLQSAEEPALRTGTIPDDLYWLSARMRGKTITGFRVTAFPVKRKATAAAEPVMSWDAFNGDFVLTEFAVEVLSSTTNVALDAPVTATHALYSQMHSNTKRPMLAWTMMTPGALTDGWPSTIAHPIVDVPNKDFFFQVDLGQARNIDHLGLLQRGDEFNLDRFGKMRVKLYEQDPTTGAKPVWQTLNRADGSFPAVGGIDILRGAQGQGRFSGRYLRISSESEVPGSPMLAEVEVYETRTARLVAVKADERDLPTSPGIRVPPGVLRLGFQLEIPQAGKPRASLYRWRVKEINEDWQSSNLLLLEIPCPPAGDFTLEVQAAHSDGEWDASVLTVPMTILVPFTRTRAFFWLVLLATLALGGMIAWTLAARRIERLKTQAALAGERTRIARDMHDDIGARLSQLTFMLKAMETAPDLPPAAKQGMQRLNLAAGETMTSLDEVVWTVNPKNDLLGPLCERLCGHATRYLAPLGITCRIDSMPSWPNFAVTAQVRHEVSMAFTEALQNIVKHSGADAVVVSLKLVNGRLVLHVADNGHGLPDAVAATTRSGITNMKARMAKVGGTCEVRAGDDGGTLVTLEIPI